MLRAWSDQPTVTGGQRAGHNHGQGSWYQLECRGRGGIEFPVDIDRSWRRRTQGDSRRAASLYQVGLCKAESEMSGGGKQLPDCAGTDEIEIELAIIDRRIVRHGQPSSMEAPIAYTYLVDGAGPSRRTIEIDL